jgi:hypothetical protein
MRKRIPSPIAFGGYLLALAIPGPFLIGGGVLGQPIVLGPEFVRAWVAYWSFNEGAGTEVQDATAHGHRGQLRNGPTWAPGRVGRALRFDGLDDYVWVPYHPDFDLPGGFSLVLWVYLESDPDTTSGNDWRLLVGRSGFRPYGLALEQDRRLTGSVYVAGERHFLRSGSELPRGEWVHLAFTFDAEAGILRLYRNGALDEEAAIEPGEVELQEGRALTISLPSPSGPEEHRAWPGRLDEVLLFGRALRPEEVQALFRGHPSADPEHPES